MNLGLVVVGSLLFLAPGLSCVIAHYQAGPNLVHRPLTSSGSVGVLAAVPIIAALAHGVAIVGFAINRAIAPHNPINLIQWPIDPYPTYISILSEDDFVKQAGWETPLGWSLIFIGILSIASVAIFSCINDYSKRRKSRKYGADKWWPGESRLAYLHRLKDQYYGTIVAAVRTKNAPYEGMLGWIGPLDSVRLSVNDDLVSIRLIEPSVYSLRPGSVNSLEDRYLEHEPPAEYEVVHIQGNDVLSVSYFFLASIDEQVEQASNNQKAPDTIEVD